MTPIPWRSSCAAAPTWRLTQAGQPACLRHPRCWLPPRRSGLQRNHREAVQTGCRAAWEERGNSEVEAGTRPPFQRHARLGSQTGC
ncbi:hypothetical protein CPCC7001_253 [Cyanobium sp. PCC 7001]|nr:hypothetical protein CPCC7001_253 [Cyanobium sp. PCC 7001]